MKPLRFSFHSFMTSFVNFPKINVEIVFFNTILAQSMAVGHPQHVLSHSLS
jgi:hypothetical protein